MAESGKKYRWFEVCPLFVAGIILFFVTNGYSNYVNRIAVSSLLWFTITWLALVFVILLLFTRKFKSLSRAGLFTGYLTGCYLFFGDIQEMVGVLPVLDHFRVVLFIMLVLCLILYRILVSSSAQFSGLTRYLNLLFLILILVDVFRIASTNDVSSVKPAAGFNFQASPDSPKPDIYLVVLDEYAGDSALRKKLHFNNHHFLQALRDRSFFVSDHSISNYTSTPVSVASVFAMDYVPWITVSRAITVRDYSNAEETMTNSGLLRFLKTEGYEFYNHSIFNIGNERAKFQPDLLATQLKLITTKTLGNQFKKHLLITLETGSGKFFDWIAYFFQEKYRKGNSDLVGRTVATAGKKSSRPRFVYTHILMPHWPFLNDSLGNVVTINNFKTLPPEQDMIHYLGYLKYTNTYALGLIDKIRSATNNQAVIILLSDHGYRKFSRPPTGFGNFNLNATYLPDQNYGYFYDGISNVNQMKIVLNSLFKTRIPLAKDSIVF